MPGGCDALEGISPLSKTGASATGASAISEAARLLDRVCSESTPSRSKPPLNSSSSKELCGISSGRNNSVPVPVRTQWCNLPQHSQMPGIRHRAHRHRPVAGRRDRQSVVPRNRTIRGRRLPAVYRPIVSVRDPDILRARDRSRGHAPLHHGLAGRRRRKFVPLLYASHMAWLNRFNRGYR